MNRFHILIVWAVTLALCSCTTTTSVVRVDSYPNAKGIRYYLPQPFILVTPTADGLQCQKLLLPDSKAQYAINIQAYLSAYNSEIKIAGGLLQSVTFDIDNTKVASQGLSSAGAVAADQIASIGQKNAAAATAANKIQGLQFAVTQAEIARDGAKEALALTPNDLTAQKAVAAAETALTTAKRRLEFAEKSGTGFLSVSDAPTATSEKAAAKYMMQPGSVLYQVVQSPRSIALVRVDKQRFVKTLGAKPGGETTKLPHLQLKDPAPIKLGDDLVLSIPDAAPSDLTIKGAIMVAKTGGKKTNLVAPSAPVKETASLATKDKITVADTYRLDLTVTGTLHGETKKTTEQQTIDDISVKSVNPP